MADTLARRGPGTGRLRSHHLRSGGLRALPAPGRCCALLRREATGGPDRGAQACCAQQRVFAGGQGRDPVFPTSAGLRSR